MCDDADSCTHLYYNSDHVRVCSLSGRCFGRKICDSFGQNVHLDNDPLYFGPVKRDQQIKNRDLTHEYIASIIAAVRPIVDMNPHSSRMISGRITRLWNLFVHKTREAGRYTHRKDKRCFVIAILTSLRDGLSVPCGSVIVEPHSFIEVQRVNKKCKHDDFKISDIRYGINLIKSAFKDTKVPGDCIISCSYI